MSKPCPRPLGLSTKEAKELYDYMLPQYLNRNQWPALVHLLERIENQQREDSNELAIAFHSEVQG